MPFLDDGLIRLFYTLHGPVDGPAMILLHGWACDANDWSHQIPLLTALGFHVIALDLRGHGQSSAPASISDYSMKSFVGDVIALLQDLHVKTAIVVAHSMGTIIASILAVEHPEVVSALILAHPIYCGTPSSLAAMSDTMRQNPGVAPDMVAGFFDKYMYTARSPEWLKTWHIRRVLATDGIALAGCGQAIVDIFDTVVGRTDEAKAYMRKRLVPRLVVVTEVLPGAAEWEEEIGLGTLDECHTLKEGVFSHFVDSEKFNDILRKWLLKGNFAAEQRNSSSSSG